MALIAANTTPFKVWGHLNLNLESITNISHLDSAFINFDKVMYVNTIYKDTVKINVHDWDLAVKNYNHANLSICVSINVEEDDEEIALQEGFLKLSNLNIELSNIILKDILNISYFCNVTKIDLDWTEFS